MPFKKTRNSRDDKSNNPSKNIQKPDQPFAAFRPKPARADGNKKPYTGKDARPERKSFNDRNPGEQRDRKFGPEERNYSKPTGDRDFKPRASGNSYGKSPDDRKYTKPTGDREFKPRASGSSYGKGPDDRKYAKPTGDREFKPRASGSSYGKGPDDRKYTKPTGDREFKPRASGSSYGKGQDDRKYAKPTGDREFKPRTSDSNYRQDPENPRSEDRGFKKRESKDHGLGEKSFRPRPTEGGFKKPASERPDFNKGESKTSGDHHYKSQDGKNRTFKRNESKEEDYPYQPKPEKSFRSGNSEGRPYKKDFGTRAAKESDFERKPVRSESKPDQRADRMASNKNLRGRKTPETAADNGLIRLNRYIANAGICSRRKADELIAAGVVSVNGEAISSLGYKVDPMKDIVRYNGEALKREKMIYVLLNKPKDYITTTDDPHERRTVMQLVEKASRERIYPVGRLDRNTTGLLLMTNDGDLAEKLSHPRNNVTKLYQVELNKNMDQGDLNKITFGLELEDGLIKPDTISYVLGGSKREIGIQIHSGKNRIVRRIFEHLGYDVVKLDRVIYGGLTKKDLPRGRWRYLEEKEVIQLKHLL